MHDDTEPSGRHDLASAYREVLESTRQATEPGVSASPDRRRAVRLATGLFLSGIGVLGYVWLGRPAWLYQIEPVPVVTPAHREATVRFGMYLQAERIRDFLHKNGRLPRDLAETGEVEEGVSYRKTGDTTFVVTAALDTVVLTLASDESAADFMKTANIRLVPGQ